MKISESRLKIFSHPLTVSVFLLAIGLLIYSNSFHAEFVFDDYGVIVDNPAIRSIVLSSQTIKSFFQKPSRNRPLSKFTFALNYAVNRLNVGGYHLVNILIHIFNAWLVFFLARQTLGQPNLESSLAASFAGLVWLVFPIHTQSVTYIVQRMNILAVMFYLVSLNSYILARRGQFQGVRKRSIYIWFLICVLSGFFGLVSKEITITLPVFIILYEWFFIQRPNSVLLKRQLPYFIIITLFCALVAFIYLGGQPFEKISTQYEKHGFTMLQRLMTQSQVVLYYLSLLAWPNPDRFILDYDFPLSSGLIHPISTALSLAALVMLTVLAAFTIRRNRLLSFAVFWYLGNLVIESSFVGLALIFEHRAYLPSIIPTIFGVVLLLRHIKPRIMSIGILCVIIVCGGFWSYQRNMTWRDKTTLWQDNCYKTPRNPRAWYNLGLALTYSGDYVRSVHFLHKSLELAVSQPGNRYTDVANICINLGVALMKTESYQKAETYFLMALQQQEMANDSGCLDTAEIYRNLGKIAKFLGRFDQMIKYYQKALAESINKTGPIHPDTAMVLNNLGVAYAAKGDPVKAGICYSKALAVFRKTLGKSHPNTKMVMENLSLLPPMADADRQKKQPDSDY